MLAESFLQKHHVSMELEMADCQWLAWWQSDEFQRGAKQRND
ncbi:hypothetical protein [Bacillus sp. FJAT-18017]|nr:hypothetical protein [Bacillus sp. FJAT-18017]